MSREHLEHRHHDHAAHLPSRLTRTFLWCIGLNLLYAAVEFLIGLSTGSMGLVADAGHNLSDVVSLILALGAVRLSMKAATKNYTYGFKKSTILASLLNAVILLIAVGIIIAESIAKFVHPAAVEGGAIAWTAGIGVLINAFTAWLLMREQRGDLNVKGAYLHMVADTLVSVGVVVSGILIARTGWYVIDPIAGLVVAAVIVGSTWRLLTGSLRLTLDGVPEGIDPDRVSELIRSTEGVSGVHHLHIWAISTTTNALTVHVILRDLAQSDEIRRALKARLKECGIAHATIETESPGCLCDEERDD